jgi:uncharacterized cupredoxin-like copper-binding protein
MKTSLPRVLVALLALAFVLAACASETGTQWTFAPTDASPQPEATATPEASAGPEHSMAPAPSAEPEHSMAPAPSAAAPSGEPPSGEARVIELQADSALRFTDPDGQQVQDIEVTPGETVIFRVDNTAGFEHDFWIGTDEQLSVPNGTTDVGIPKWTSGVQELEWVVPDDVSGLKFGCTVPGHYNTMQGTFTATAAVGAAEPADSAAPAQTAEAAAPADSGAPAQPAAAPADGEARVIELEADAAIRFLQDGQQIQDIAVTPGETVIFRVDNTAGFLHNFYIGTDSELQVMGGTTDTGIPDWESGVQELEWVVPDDVSDIRFACTVPGHYYTMQGDFTVSP